MDKRGKDIFLKSLLSYLVGKKNGSQACSLQGDAWEIVPCEIFPNQWKKKLKILLWQ